MMEYLHCENRLRELGLFKLIFGIRNKIFTSSKILKQAAQRGGGCPDLGYIQGQVGLGFEQNDLAVDVPVHCKRVGLEDI